MTLNRVTYPPGRDCPLSSVVCWSYLCRVQGGVGGRRSGRCKWFNVVKGFGFITPDDGGQDVFVHQTVIQMPGFRSLGEGEAVEFECRPSEKGIEATFVCGPTGSDCRGSDRRPISRKKFRRIRCYNCGDFANHIAAKCPHGPLPKRCHFCKSSDHLIADCPSRKADREAGNSSSNGEYSDTGGGAYGEPSKSSTLSGQGHQASSSSS
ncbi:hypothetical protein LSH36_146g01063 [Paralvinella palmiformis]|uniref:CSD domain-containing protein n=1 Tax=Paralvinella palmiformis TaxID=53620 RepID=A0AAD9JUR2_9ANNE|nr:hypothetical protein LSH36_146g01063 [Paralvinella palmiformis]